MNIERERGGGGRRDCQRNGGQTDGVPTLSKRPRGTLPFREVIKLKHAFNRGRKGRGEGTGRGGTRRAEERLGY